MGKKLPDYWDASTKMLTDPTIFLDSLLNFDKENIPESVIQKIEPYIAMESFTPEQVQGNHFLVKLVHIFNIDDPYKNQFLKLLRIID